MEGVTTTCPVCHGRRFTGEVLRHRLDGRSIADVLDLTADEAAEALAGLAPVGPAIAALVDVGLGYLTLGQPLSTLSGGECQRLRLATEIHRPPAGEPLYVLDEPTTGLHMADVGRLVGILDRLVEGGASVLVIEHDLDVVRRADWVIDLGPGPGHHGGRVVFAGTPAQLRDERTSVTAGYLRRDLAAGRGLPISA